MAVAHTLTDAILDAVPADRRPQPRLTYYDDAGGERTELSTATLANWAAKTANYLRDGLGLVPGFRVDVQLPEHWQTAAVLLGVWWAGGEVVHVGPTAADDDETVDVLFTTSEALDDRDADEVVAVPLDAFGLARNDLPVGVNDFAGSVRVHGDFFTSAPAAVDPLPGDGNAVDLARKAAADAGIGPEDRVLSTRPWVDRSSVIAGLVAPLLAGASLVQVRNGDPDRAAARLSQEKVTRTIGD